MSNNIYALFVGIDIYHPESTPGVSTLSGCVNDIDVVEAYLRTRVATGNKWNLVEPLILKNQQATRQAIIEGFQKYLSQANSNDIVLFYYAGHGAQEVAPKEFWKFEPDHLNETLVCYDSRTKNSNDLADKELAYLIYQIAQKNPQIVIILDCCHSGSGTRDPEIKIRQTDVDRRKRPLRSYIFAQDQIVINKLSVGFEWLKGKHVVMSACRAHQKASEYYGDAKHRGAFSYFLLKTLERTNGSLTYRDLLRNVNALIVGKVREQSPQVEATDTLDLDNYFLGSAISERPAYFTLTYSKTYSSWVIDGGDVYGIPQPSKGDTLLAIFRAGSPPEQLYQLDNKLCEAKVTQVMPHQSKVQIEAGKSLSSDPSYWAIITSLPLEPLKVYIQGESGAEQGVQLALKVLNQIGPGQKPSLYVRQVNESKKADYHLLVRNSQYWIVQPTNSRPCAAPIPKKPDRDGYTPERARQVILRLEHIARWTNILELESPVTSQIKPSDVEMEIIAIAGNQSYLSNINSYKSADTEIRLEYTYENGEWRPPALKLRLTNYSQKDLYCNVLNLEENYVVDVPFFEEQSSIRLVRKDSGPDATIESFEVDMVIPDDYLAQGITEYTDIFKLIVSNADFDASLLQQDGLDLAPVNRYAGSYSGTLNRLMEQVSTRKALRRDHGNYDDWMTKQVKVIIVMPRR